MQLELWSQFGVKAIRCFCQLNECVVGILKVGAVRWFRFDYDYVMTHLGIILEISAMSGTLLIYLGPRREI